MRIGYFKIWLMSLLGIKINRNFAYIDADIGLYYFYPNPNEWVSESAKMDQKIITGTVTDETSEPVVGVNILIENTSKGTVTDIDGKYSIEANVRFHNSKKYTEKDRLIAKWKKEFETEIIPYDDEYLYKKAMIEKYDREFSG